jgi:tetratricopeptide (TPR) repeat protein
LLGHPAKYLEQLRSKALLDHPSLQGRGSSLLPTEHDPNVARTFALSYERLDATDPTDSMALAFLARAAYFAPGEPIPRELLLKTVNLDDSFDVVLQAEDALRRLTDLGLLETEAAGALRLHRLLAAYAQGAASDGEAQTAVEQSLLEEANRLNNAGYPAPLLAWQPHLRFVTDRAQTRVDERAAGLCNTLGYHLNMIGDLAGAKPYYERALAIYTEVLGEKHPDTASSLNNLGYLLQAQGDLAGAKPYYERALAIFTEKLGPEHPYAQIVRKNLMTLEEMGGSKQND